MALTQLKYIKDNVNVVNAFLGVNKGLHIGENEFSDMSNMTNDYYPVLSTRKKRGIIMDLHKPQAMMGGRYLTYIDNNKLYYDFSMIKELPELEQERQLVMMGAYLCIFPDGIIYNTYTKEFSEIKNETHTTSTVTMRMCKLDGTEFNDENTYIGKEEPTDKEKYPYWLDTSSNTVILKMWSSTYSMWTSVATTYVKIASEGIGKGFKEYDAVKVSGINTKGYNDYDFNDTLIVYAADEDYIIVAGLIDLYYTQEGEVTVQRELPELDYVCELDNRIWGCSSKKHEIYACKQGDPTNWNFYGGFDSDSYAATVGTQDDFTGAAAYGGYVFFFKEDGMHKLYGSRPSNYEMLWKPGRGVQKGCSKSIAVVNEVLFYKSRDAICAYDGSTDTISDKLGIEPYYEAVGAGYRSKYYISMRDADYHYKLYVFDMTKGTWCIEDANRIKYMAYADNGNYFIDASNTLFVINNEKIFTNYFPSEWELGDTYTYPNENLYPGKIVSGTLEENIEWDLTTGDLGLDNPYNKYVKRVNIRLLLDNETKIKIEVEYDTSGEWEYVGEYYCRHKRSYELPIAVRRADHIRLRLSGFGNVKIYSIAKAVEAGSGETNGES